VRDRPLVAVFFRVPLLVEALRQALDGVGEVRAFPSPTTEPLQLLEAFMPDAVIVDGERDAKAALAYAGESRVPVLYLPWGESQLYAAREGEWVAVPGGPAPEAIRNALAEAFVERVS
jgi:hypothetical protein